MHGEFRVFPRFVYLTTAACCTIGAAYTLIEIEPSPAVGLIVPLAPLIAILFWFQEDARRTSLAGVQDWGLFLWIAWPFLLPWYVFRIREQGGWRLLLLTIALVFAPIAAIYGVAVVRWLIELTMWRLRGGA